MEKNKILILLILTTFFLSFCQTVQEKQEENRKEKKEKISKEIDSFWNGKRSFKNEREALIAIDSCRKCLYDRIVFTSKEIGQFYPPREIDQDELDPRLNKTVLPVLQKLSPDTLDFLKKELRYLVTELLKTSSLEEAFFGEIPPRLAMVSTMPVLDPESNRWSGNWWIPIPIYCTPGLKLKNLYFLKESMQLLMCMKRGSSVNTTVGLNPRRTGIQNDKLRFDFREVEVILGPGNLYWIFIKTDFSSIKAEIPGTQSLIIKYNYL